MVWARYFDCELELLDEMPFGEDRDQAALQAFLTLDARDRDADTRHVIAYYRDIEQAAVAGGEDPFALIAPGSSPTAIWAHVTPVCLACEPGRDDDPHTYVVAECECAWEPEHGLMMVWRDGHTLCKVGDYDGHVTNADAYANPSLAQIVYAAHDPRFSTTEDERRQG